MKVTPTPATAALAGAFSAIVWPFVWERFGSSASVGSFELIIATLLVVALPAHAFVVGFGHSQVTDRGSLDSALLKRIGAWLATAIVAALVGSALDLY